MARTGPEEAARLVSIQLSAATLFEPIRLGGAPWAAMPRPRVTRPMPDRQNDSVAQLLVEDFIRLETQVWRALAGGDADADGRLLSNDFLGVYPTGFADRKSHVEQLIDGPTVTSFALHDARMLTVSESAVILSYRAEFVRPTSTVASEVQWMYVSSLWCRRDEAWLNVFSQDTPAE